MGTFFDIMRKSESSGSDNLGSSMRPPSSQSWAQPDPERSWKPLSAHYSSASPDLQAPVPLGSSHLSAHSTPASTEPQMAALAWPEEDQGPVLSERDAAQASKIDDQTTEMPAAPSTVSPNAARAVNEAPVAAVPLQPESGKMTVIGKNMAVEGARMTSPGHDVAIHGTLSGVVNCGSFTIAEGGYFEGRIIASETVQILGKVRDSRIVARTVLIWETGDVGGDTVVVANDIGVQRGARINARIIGDGALDTNEKVTHVDDPASYPDRPVAIEGSL
jgi:cytoskeletal protein CcmA (bactofilin family)